MVENTGGTQAGPDGGQQAKPMQELHYLPIEFCLTLAPKRGEALAPGDELIAEVQVALNTHLPALIPRLMQQRRGAFAADLDFSLLLSYFSGGSRVQLRPTPPPSPGQRIPTPEVRFAGPRGDELALHFFQFEDVFTGPTEPNRTEIVRQLVNFVNLNVDAVNQELAGRTWDVVAATPNWLHAGADDGVTGGGPGSRPEPAKAGKRFEFANDALRAELKKPRRGRVVVAVLDTSPSKDELGAAADRYGQQNELLRKVADHLLAPGAGRIDGDLSIPESYYSATRLDEITTNWRLGHPEDEPLTFFEMPDHGLFAAGIIYDVIRRAAGTEYLPPQFEIYLIRVLSKYGAGDTDALTTVLSELPKKFLLDGKGEPNDTRLIVNLSLVADLPPGVSIDARDARGQRLPSKAFLDFWLPNTSTRLSQQDLDRLLRDPQNKPVADAITLTQMSLQEAIRWLSGQPGPGGQRLPDGDRRNRELLIAAAGNDSPEALPDDDRPVPRLPARYDDVLGVGALKRSLDSARYSNLGDDVTIGDGVAVFGGDAKPDHPGRIDMHPVGGDVDAVVGIFSAPTLPLAGPPTNPPEDRTNDTGWAYWSGTSFATPIISGIAACLWSADPNAAAPAIMRKVFRADFVRPGQHLHCPTLEVKQV